MAINRGAPKGPKKPKIQAAPAEGEAEGQPKSKLPKFELTSKIVMQRGGAGVAILIALLFGWISLSRGCTRHHVLEAYSSYDANLPTPAQKHLESALWWDSGHLGARIMQAKLWCDAGSEKMLLQAQKAYLDLANEGYDSEPQVMAGLGVVSLKLADRAPIAEADPLIEQARQYFQAAGGIPEAHIGLGHCDLIQARKHNDPNFLASAKTKFVNIRKIMESDPEFRAQCTRDGLIDYYSGIGKALALGGTFDPDSVKALQACSQLTDRWIMPRANLLRLEAVRLGTVEMELGETETAKKNGLELLSKMRQTAVTQSGDDKVIMDDARLIYLLSMASALGRAGDFRGYDELRVRAVSSFAKRMEPFIFDAVYQTERAEVGHPDTIQMGKLVNSAKRAYRALRQKLNAEDPVQKDLRVRILNNNAWMGIWTGDIRKGVSRYYREAHADLMEAVKLAPDDYMVNRNLVVVSLRMEHKPEVYAPYVARARAAAQGPFAADFAELEKALAQE